MLAPQQAPRYLVNGQYYDSYESAVAAANAPAKVAASDTGKTLEIINRILEDHDKRRDIIRRLFRQYAGTNQMLEQHEMMGLARMLCMEIGIDESFFENAQQMFYRFDFSGDEKLDADECNKLIKYLLKEQKRMLSPPVEGVDLTHLERKNLEQNFELGKKLGQGGQGAVYLATEKATGTKRVVKFYQKDGGNSCLEDIKDEFELLKRMDHPNIARICEVFEDYSNIYVISEPYTGGDLCTVTQKAQEHGVALTHDWLGLIFLQVLEGIRYLHSKNTMHCDLKEPNVMIADNDHWDNPHAMLIDFGMAKNFSGTRAGGTPGYMPPEFWQYNLWTPKGDMFALAVTFWSIYNFRQGGPFCVPDAGPPFPNIRNATISSPMNCSAFPPGLQELIQQMAEKDFRRRPSAKQAVQHPYFQRLSKGEGAQPLDKGMIENMCKAADRSAAQNMIAMEIASSKNLGQMKEMNALFRQLDKDQDGTVEGAEAASVLAKCGVPAEAAQKLIDSLTGSNGKISYSEFMAKMITGQEAMSSADLANVFRQIDGDGSGTLDRGEITKLMAGKHMEKIMDGRSPDDLLQEMDANGDGVISFNEFRRAMLGGSSKKTDLSVGDKVDYHSPSHGQWVPCEITHVDAKSGAVQITVKPGCWLSTHKQKEFLRKHGGGGGYS